MACISESYHCTESQFDAGVLFVHQSNDDSAKLCFEFSPEKEGLVVSVITRETFDDCNGAQIQIDTVHMRVSRYGQVVASHYKYFNCAPWRLHCIFRLRDPNAATSVGFLSQAPMGDGHTAIFSHINIAPTTLKDPRDGS